MTDLPECPCCGGIIMLQVHRNYNLTSACRCGYPEKVTWDDFPSERAELDPKKRPDERWEVAA